MAPRSIGSAGRRVILMIAIGIVIVACSGGPATPSPAPSATAAGSGSPCPTAPTPGNLDAWQPPSSAPPFLPVLISSDQVCGANRFLFGLVGPDNRPMAAPDRGVHVAFYDLGADAASPVAAGDGTFIWAIDDVVGVYVMQVAFASTGVWGAEFTAKTADRSPATVRMTFDVIAHGRAVQVGERAPASRTKTLTDVGADLARISSDLTPIERFYETSVDAALAAHEPFVLAFATPKFCVTGQCGPTLERVKPVAAAFPDVTVINVEPYELEFTDGALQAVLSSTGELVPVAATREWGLPSEPWIFVVDRDGIVTASFEGIVSEEELQAAVEAVR